MWCQSDPVDDLAESFLLIAVLEQVLQELGVTAFPTVAIRHAHPFFLLQELNEHQSSHQVLDIVANSFLGIGEILEFLHDGLAGVAIIALNPSAIFLDHALACNELNDVLVVGLVLVKEVIAKNIN